MKTRKRSITLETCQANPGFVPEESNGSISIIDVPISICDSSSPPDNKQDEADRQQWTSGVEFLMSCIAMSVGLGNVWRFPFTAYENGGGAFVIPYIIVLIVVGRPLYYLEMAIGQFTSKGIVKIWEVSPALIGIGYGQVIAAGCILSYYVPLMAISTFYLFASFSSELPWSRCDPSWDNCFDSSGNISGSGSHKGLSSSSELYFLKSVLHEKDQIDDGVGVPDWKLTLCLLFSWGSIFLILCKGVKSSGKVAYFLALFPYVVLTSLLIRGATLPGAVDGIIFFVNPQWSELLNPNVWYAAVTQAFFSLGVSVGALVTYSSYNGFNHNIHRDALIVTSIDTFTSLLAGCTIFSILGNLAHESGSDVASVVKGGTGLAFVSYPDAIAKFEFVPQLFSVLFFFMLFILGIGSAISLQGSITGMFSDQFPKVKGWRIELIVSCAGFLIGLVYVTPGGQYILSLVDYYGSSFILFILGAVEVVALSWVYGLNNFCLDLEFMLNRKTGVYWRLCWGIITPFLLLVILTYSLVTLTPLTYNGYKYPSSAYAAGAVLLAFGLLQIPIGAVYIIHKLRNSQLSIWGTIVKGFSPSEKWGPSDPKTKMEWQQFRKKEKEEIESLQETPLQNISRTLFNTRRN